MAGLYREIYREGVDGWDSLGDIPPEIRLLLGIDGSLTRALEFLGCGNVRVELLPPPSSRERRVNLCLPVLGNVVHAVTRLSDQQADQYLPLLSDPRPIGPLLHETQGPLVRRGLVIFQSLGTGFPDDPWSGHTLWGREYNLVAQPGPHLTLREWFLPSLVGFFPRRE